MSAPSAIEAARRILEKHQYDNAASAIFDTFAVARAYLEVVETQDEAIEECAKIADAEGLSPNASASYCAAAFHIGMCIRSLKNKPLNTWY